jgi:hypothetical protein
MANIIKPKRSNTASKVPNTTELTSGELGVNMADKKVYINNGTAVVQVGAGNLSGLGDVVITTPSNNQTLVYNSTTSQWNNATAGAGSGTVTSVATGSGLTGGPITTSGTISLATAYGDTVNPYASKTANNFLAAPNGTAGVPTFRAIVAADIPTLNQNTTGTAANVTGTVAVGNGGTGATTAAGAQTNLGVPSTTGTGASGTWGISISGNAATATTATNATSATTAGNVTGVVAVANGGTGSTTAAGALTNLGAYAATNPNGYITSSALSSYLPLSGGTVTGPLIGNGGFANVDGGIRIANPGGAAYATQSATVTGAIKIRLPAAALGSNTMLSFRVRVYQYSAGLSHEFVVAGYNYNDASWTWYNVSAMSLSDAGGDFTVRFGKDATSQCIYIGELGSTWSYPQVHVTDFSGGYSGMGAAMWSTGWNISFEATAFAGVTNSRTAWRDLTPANYNSYAPTLTGGGASGTWGISVTGNAATATNVAYSGLTGAVPTWNQNTTGTAANVSGTVAVANGGTGATTAANALTNLGAYPSSNPSGYTSNTGTVTGVTATAPVVSSGGTAPVISMAAASSTVNGYLTSTDWNTFNSKGSGTVTSVGGTGTVSGLTLSGTVTGSGNLTLGGTLSLTSGNVTTALGYTPYNSTNPNGYITSSGSISGNAATVSNITRADSGSADLNTLTTSGFYRVNSTNANRPGDWGQLLTVYGGSDTIGQLYFDYVSGNTFSRAGNPSNVGGSGAWSAWRTNLNSFNYNSYAPTLTGVGASGSWAINITGTAASITGVYGGTLTSGQVTTAIGYTPYNSTNPNGYTSNTGTVTSVGGTGTVSGLTLTGTVTSSGSLTLGGNLSITADMIYDNFTATASQTTFTTSTTYTSGKIQVFVNGVKLRNGTDCTVTSGTSVVMAVGLPVGTLVDLVYPT